MTHLGMANEAFANYNNNNTGESHIHDNFPFGKAFS
jgi:hypothetical protein